LAIHTGSFTSGRSVASLVKAWKVDLFLSNDHEDVAAALLGGTAAATLGRAPIVRKDGRACEVRIAFDGDCVLFGPQSDEIYKRHGLDAFLRHETANADVPMIRGPFSFLLGKLSVLRRAGMAGHLPCLVRIALVTSRGAPSHSRVINTFRSWGMDVDEVHLIGDGDKSRVLRALEADIFFDDQERHILAASRFVAAGHVPVSGNAATAATKKQKATIRQSDRPNHNLL